MRLVAPPTPNGDLPPTPRAGGRRRRGSSIQHSPALKNVQGSPELFAREHLGLMRRLLGSRSQRFLCRNRRLGRWPRRFFLGGLVVAGQDDESLSHT